MDAAHLPELVEASRPTAECLPCEMAQKTRAKVATHAGTTHGGSDAEDMTEPAEAEGSALEAVLSGAVAKLVCQEAIKNVPDSLAFRQRLLEALEGFSFAGVQAIAQDIYAGVEVLSFPNMLPNFMQPSARHGCMHAIKRPSGVLKPMRNATAISSSYLCCAVCCAPMRQSPGLPPFQADFGDREDAWDLRARRCTGALASTSEAEPLEAAAAVFEAATAAMPTSRMYDLYAAFLLEQVCHSTAGDVAT